MNRRRLRHATSEVSKICTLADKIKEQADIDGHTISQLERNHQSEEIHPDYQIEREGRKASSKVAQVLTPCSGKMRAKQAPTLQAKVRSRITDHPPPTNTLPITLPIPLHPHNPL